MFEGKIDPFIQLVLLAEYVLHGWLGEDEQVQSRGTASSIGKEHRLLSLVVQVFNCTAVNNSFMVTGLITSPHGGGGSKSCVTSDLLSQTLSWNSKFGLLKVGLNMKNIICFSLPNAWANSFYFVFVIYMFFHIVSGHKIFFYSC